MELLSIVVVSVLIFAIIYLNGARKKCPFCKSENVSEKFLNPSSNTYCRKCNNCGQTFTA